MSLRKAQAATIAACLTVATLATGCGATRPGLAGLAGMAPRAESEALGKASKRRYRLGANLAGRHRVKFDEPEAGLEGFGFQLEADPLPARVDLRDLCPPVYDQGPLGSCTGFAIAKGLGEVLLKKHNRHRRLSALHLYWQERKAEGTLNRDAGAYISTGMDVLRRDGVVREEDHPYPPPADWDDDRKVRQAMVAAPSFRDPDPETMFRFKSHDKMDSLRGIRTALSNARPVVIGIDLFESFFDPSVERTGVVPTPLAGEKAEGGHAVLVVGYDNARRQLIVRNSWGAGWGDRGYFYLSYDYIRAGLGGDAWTAFYDADIIRD